MIDLFYSQVLNNSHPLWYLLKQNSQPQPHHRHHYRHSHRQPRLLQETSRPACELMESFIRPRAARNTDLEWRFIVNDIEEEDTEYQQIVRVGKCMGTHECSGSWPGQVGLQVQIFLNLQIILNALKLIILLCQITQCRQQYLDHKLVVMSLTGEVLLDTFNFPSCCACHVLNIEY